MPSYKRTPLLMYPNGTFARSSTIEEGCVVVVEPEIKLELGGVLDQTKAVKEANKNDW